MKITLLNHSIAHYNRSLYEILLSNPNYQVELIGGDAFLGIKNANLPNAKLILLKTFFLKISSHTFFYQKKLLRTVLLSKPDVIILSGVDIHFLQSLFIFFYYKIFTNVKVIWWSHGKFKSLNKIGTFLRKNIYNWSDAVMVYALKGKNILVEIGAKQAPIVVIGNCLNIEDYGYDKYCFLARSTNHQVLKLIFTGRLTKEKKINLLIDALAFLEKTGFSEWSCNIIGNGTEYDMLIELTKKYQLESKISFLGEKYGKDLDLFLRDANLMIIPNATGLSIIHALSYGLPIITSDKMDEHGPEIELLESNTTGDFFISDNVEDLANKILKWHKLLTNSIGVDYRNQCINKIKAYHYTPQDVATKIFQVLDGLFF